jgi:hypothetical protein
MRICYVLLLTIHCHSYLLAYCYTNVPIYTAILGLFSIYFQQTLYPIYIAKKFFLTKKLQLATFLSTCNLRLRGDRCSHLPYHVHVHLPLFTYTYLQNVPHTVLQQLSRINQEYRFEIISSFIFSATTLTM